MEAMATTPASAEVAVSAPRPAGAVTGEAEPVGPEAGGVDFLALILRLVGGSPDQMRTPTGSAVAEGTVATATAAAEAGAPGAASGVTQWRPTPGALLDVAITPVSSESLRAGMGGMQGLLDVWSEAQQEFGLFEQAADGGPTARRGELIVVPVREIDLPAPPQLAAADAGAADLTTARVMFQLVKAVGAGAERNVERLRIRLHPPALGRVDVTLSLRDGGLSASIRVENEQVRALVESNLGVLRESLSAAGLDLSGFDVSSFDKRYDTMPMGGRRFARGIFRLAAAEDEAAGEDLGVRIAWPWSAIDTIA